MVRTMAVAAAVLVLVAAPRAQSRSYSYVTVIDDDGRPVRGLDSENFALRDGPVRRGVLDAEPATEPLAIAVVIDGWDAGDLAGVNRAIAALHQSVLAKLPASQIGVVVTDALAASRVVMLPRDPDAVMPALAGAVRAGRGQLLSSLIDATVALGAAPTDRRVVLAVVRLGDADPIVSDGFRLTDAMARHKAALWTAEYPREPRKGPLNDLFSAAADLGGAVRQTAADQAGIGPAVERVTDLLLSQYVVTYAWPDPMLSALTISTRHNRGQVLFPRW